MGYSNIILLTEIKDKSTCYFCGSKIKREGSSLHVWDIEYECGSRMFGAIDTDTHGKLVSSEKKCKTKSKLVDRRVKVNEEEVITVGITRDATAFINLTDDDIVKTMTILMTPEQLKELHSAIGEVLNSKKNE